MILYMAVKRNTAIAFSRAACPSFRSTGTHVMLKTELVKGAANDASPEKGRFDKLYGADVKKEWL